MTRVLLVLALVGCKFNPDKLAAVCDGTGYSRAAEGTEVTATAQKWVRSPVWSLDRTAEPERASRVVCVEQVAGAFERDCPMETMDTTMELGNGAPKVVQVHARPGDVRVIKAHAARYTLTLRDARTAKVIAQKTIDAPVEHCPMITLGSDLVDYADLPDGAVDAFTRAARAP